jgi:hypothetical protein
MIRSFVANFGLLIAVLSASAQTYFVVSNESRSNEGPFLPPVLNSIGMPLTDTNFVAELWGSATPDSLAPLLVYNTIPRKRLFAQFVRPGYFIGFGTVVVDNVPDGGRAWLQVRVWDIRLGATYEEVAARGIGGFGESPLFYGKGTRGPGCEPPCLPGDLTGLQSFKVRAMTGVLLRSIRREGSDVVLEWWPGFKKYRVQQSSDLNQPWQDLGPPTSATSVTNAMTQPPQFFRVIGLTEVTLATR